MGRKKYKILVIDDDPNIIMLFNKMLVDLPYLILSADSIEEGRKIAVHSLPHIIFLDINLADSSGFEFLHWMQKQEKLKKTSVIMISGDSFSSNIITAKTLGAEDFIVKPLVNKTIVQKIRKSLLNKKNHEVLIKGRNCLCECHLPIRSVVSGTSSMTIDCEAKLSEEEKFWLASDINKRAYRKDGGGVRKTAHIERVTLSLVGDYDFLEDEKSTTKTYHEEEILSELAPRIWTFSEDKKLTELVSHFFTRFNSDVVAFDKISLIKEIFTEHRPDVFIIEVRKGSSDEVLSLVPYVRKLYEDLPLLIVADSQKDVEVETALNFGANDFVVKPLKRNIFLHKIVNFVSPVKYKHVESNLSAKKDHKDFLVFEGNILKIDEHCIVFSSKSFIRSGSKIKLNIELLSNGSTPREVELKVTNAGYSESHQHYHVVGEYCNFDPLYVSELMGRAIMFNEV